MTLLDNIRFSRAVDKGLAIFEETGQTPDWAYQALIQMFCRTQGAHTDKLHAQLQAKYPVVNVGEANGVLGRLSGGDVSKIAASIERDGYYVFPQLLPEDVTNGLVKVAQTTPGILNPKREGVPVEAIYDAKNPLAERYMFEEGKLLEFPEFQMLAADKSLLAVVQAYLGMEPILDMVTMWWSSQYSKEASATAAQLYHFDMDRIKWLKFFFYLTDVTPDTGPHCYVRGSNRSKSQPKDILSRGYARISDEDMAKNFKAEDFVEICGKRGSIIAVDTRGFHKGKVPVAGDRLLVQTEYTDSLFGTVYKRFKLDASNNPELKEMIAKHPRVYSKYDLV